MSLGKVKILIDKINEEKSSLNNVRYKNGNSFFIERINSYIYKTNKRKNNISDINLLINNINKYSEYFEVSISQIFNNGEIHISEEIIYSNFLPIENIMILKESEGIISDITSECFIDKINGAIKINQNNLNCKISLIYTNKKIDIIEEIIEFLPPKYELGLFTT